MKDPASDEWLAWLLVATTDANVVPVGGHYRFRISADGRTLIRRDALSASCLSLNKTQDAPAGGQPVGLAASHIVSDHPVETHVFLSLLNRIQIYVAAGDKLWNVNGITIIEVDQAPR